MISAERIRASGTPIMLATRSTTPISMKSWSPVTAWPAETPVRAREIRSSRAPGSRSVSRVKRTSRSPIPSIPGAISAGMAETGSTGSRMAAANNESRLR